MVHNTDLVGRLELRTRQVDLGTKGSKVLAACIPRQGRCLQNKATFLTPGLVCRPINAGKGRPMAAALGACRALSSVHLLIDEWIHLSTHVSHCDIRVALFAIRLALLAIPLAFVDIHLAALIISGSNSVLVASLAAAILVSLVVSLLRFGLLVLLTQPGEAETPVGLHLCSSVAEQANLAPLLVAAQGFAHHQIDVLRLEALGFDCKVVSYAPCMLSFSLLTPVIEYIDVNAHILRQHRNLEQVRRSALLHPILQHFFVLVVPQHSVRRGRSCMVKRVALANHIVRLPAARVSDWARILDSFIPTRAGGQQKLVSSGPALGPKQRVVDPQGLGRRAAGIPERLVLCC